MVNSANTNVADLDFVQARSRGMRAVPYLDHVQSSLSVLIVHVATLRMKQNHDRDIPEQEPQRMGQQNVAANGSCSPAMLLVQALRLLTEWFGTARSRAFVQDYRRDL